MVSSSSLEIISRIREVLKVRPRNPPFRYLKLYCPVCGGPLRYSRSANKSRFECDNPECPLIRIFLSRKKEPCLVFDSRHLAPGPNLGRRETRV